MEGRKEPVEELCPLQLHVLVSALIFRGEVSTFVDLRKRGLIVPVISRETFDELRSALEYPEFRLTKREIRSIIDASIF